MIKELSCYIDGLVTMATSLSKKISHSGIDTTCFKSKNFKEEFSKYYKVSLNKVIDENKSLKEILSLYLEENLVNNLTYLIQNDLGKEISIYTVEDINSLEKLSCFNGGKVPFYFIEDIYIVEYKKYFVCFIMGNNE